MTSKRVVIYTRISKDVEGLGAQTERQAEQCRKLADLRGWEVVAHKSDESISAYSGKVRPAWGEVLQMVELGQVDIIVAWHLDRMTRSMIELENLILLSETHGVGIATVSGDIDLTNDVGRMVARILAAVARAEVERKSARQRIANEQRANAGIPFRAGIRPFGYDDDHETLRPDEARLIAKAAKDVLAGVTLKAVADDWIKQGFSSSRWKGDDQPAWTATGVRNLLMNPRYAGISTYRGVEVGEGTWDAVFDRDTHEALKRLLSDPTRRRTVTGAGGRKPKNLLSGLATCGVCGAGVRGSKSKALLTYACPRKCVQVDRAKADSWVESLTVAMLEQPIVSGPLTKVADVDAAGLRDEYEDLTKKLNAWIAEGAAEGFTPSQIRVATEPIRAQLEEVEGRMSAAIDMPDIDEIKPGTHGVEKRWESLPLERKQPIIRFLLDHVKVMPIPEGQWRPPISERIATGSFEEVA
jgi:site-specific DNA recombinase